MHLRLLLLALVITTTTQAFSSTRNNNNSKHISTRRVSSRAHNIHKLSSATLLEYRSINLYEEDEYHCNDIHPSSHELQLQELDREESRLILAKLQQSDFNTPFTEHRQRLRTSTKSISNEEEDSSFVETVKAFLPVAFEIGAVVSLTSNHVQ